MTPANYIADLLRGAMEARGYKVFTNNMPDEPDKAIAIYDQPGGRLEGRLMRSGDVVEHPMVQVTVRGKKHSEASEALPDVWEVLGGVYRWHFEDGKILQCITKSNTMGSLGHEPQTRRVRYTQQFRMTFLE